MDDLANSRGHKVNMTNLQFATHKKPKKLIDFVLKHNCSIIVWFAYIRKLQTFKQALDDNGKQSVVMCGMQDFESRTTNIDKFRNGEIKVILISSALCTGYNLNTNEAEQIMVFDYTVTASRRAEFFQQKARISPFKETPRILHVYADCYAG